MFSKPFFHYSASLSCQFRPNRQTPTTKFHMSRNAYKRYPAWFWHHFVLNVVVFVFIFWSNCCCSQYTLFFFLIVNFKKSQKLNIIDFDNCKVNYHKKLYFANYSKGHNLKIVNSIEMIVLF